MSSAGMAAHTVLGQILFVGQALAWAGFQKPFPKPMSNIHRSCAHTLSTPTLG